MSYRGGFFDGAFYLLRHKGGRLYYRDEKRFYSRQDSHEDLNNEREAALRDRRR